MNVWANAVLTDQGRALLAKLTQGNTLEITRAVTGAGFVTPGFLSDQTAVTLPKQTLSFKPVSYPEKGVCKFPVALTNEGLTTGYDAKQVGLFANDPDYGEILLFIVQSRDADTGTPIPSETEMPGYAAEWTFYFQYGQAGSVSVTIDPANTVSRGEMEAYVANNAVTQEKMEAYMAINAVTPTQMEEYVANNAVTPTQMEEYVANHTKFKPISSEQISALFGA